MKGKYYILLLLLSISIKVKAQIEIPKFVYVLNSKCLTTYIGERKWVSDFSVYNEKGQDLGHYEYIGRYSCKRIVVAKKEQLFLDKVLPKLTLVRLPKEIWYIPKELVTMELLDITF